MWSECGLRMGCKSDENPPLSHIVTTILMLGLSQSVVNQLTSKVLIGFAQLTITLALQFAWLVISYK